MQRLTWMLLVASLALPVQAAETVVFQEGVNGYTGASELSFDWDGGGGSSGQVRLDQPGGGQFGNYAALFFNDVFGTSPSQVPQGATILSATLDGFVTNQFNSATIHRLLQDVSNRPTTAVTDGAGTFYVPTGYTAIDVSASNSPSPPTPIQWDVTSSVQAWSDGDMNFGLLLIPDTTNGGNIAPSEPASALSPFLTITFEQQLPLTPEPASVVLLGCGIAVAGLMAWRKQRRMSA